MQHSASRGDATPSSRVGANAVLLIRDEYADFGTVVPPPSKSRAIEEGIHEQGHS
jgi:hypothetical protein